MNLSFRFLTLIIAFILCFTFQLKASEVIYNSFSVEVELYEPAEVYTFGSYEVKTFIDDGTMESTSKPPEEDNSMVSTSNPPEEDNSMVSTSNPPEEDNSMVSTSNPPEEDNSMVSTSNPPEEDNSMVSTSNPPEEDNSMVSTSNPPEEDNSMVSTSSPPEEDNSMVSTSNPPEEDNSMVSTSSPPDISEQTYKGPFVLNIEVNKSSASKGDSLIYELSFFNNSDMTVISLTVRDTLPLDLTFLKVINGGSETFDLKNLENGREELLWKFSEVIEPAGSRSIKFEAKIKED